MAQSPNPNHIGGLAGEASPHPELPLSGSYPLAHQRSGQWHKWPKSLLLLESFHGFRVTPQELGQSPNLSSGEAEFLNTHMPVKCLPIQVFIPARIFAREAVENRMDKVSALMGLTPSVIEAVVACYCCPDCEHRACHVGWTPQALCVPALVRWETSWVMVFH